MRIGVRLAVDWGKARIGVAACDQEGILAYPVETVGNDEQALDRLASLIREYQPIELILGLPKALTGAEGLAASAMREVAAVIAKAFPGLDIRLVDERLTTVSAAKSLRAAGRKAKAQREIIDQAAAVALLTGALESEKQTGLPPGDKFIEEIS
jgi:putative Holliday junction resolvase